jgi:hypothetical protein
MRAKVIHRNGLLGHRPVSNKQAKYRPEFQPKTTISG